MKDVGFIEHLAVVDCAAKTFAEMRPSRTQSWGSASRTICRQHAVTALRWLWKTGDASQRATVASRVAVWMLRPNVNHICSRVYERESGRLTCLKEAA